MTASKENKLFGKWNDLILLLIGFILTSIVGGFISFMIQNRSWDHQYNQTLLQSEKQKAESVFTDVSSLMDNRIYKMRKIIWGFSTNENDKEINQRWDDYKKILDDWNINLNKNLALVQIYFGDEARQIFENKIHSQLREAGLLLEKAKKNGKIDDYEKVTDLLDPINVEIYHFDLYMLERISNERIGRFK